MLKKIVILSPPDEISHDPQLCSVGLWNCWKGLQLEYDDSTGNQKMYDREYVLSQLQKQKEENELAVGLVVLLSQSKFINFVFSHIKTLD